MEWKSIKKNKRLAEAREKLEDEKVRGRFRWVIEILATLALASLTALAMFQSVTMQESSMEPTISIGDRFFVNRILYRVSSPQRGDIIVFRKNASNEAALHIRRIIGLPGETVQITDGRVLINGETYRESRDFPKISNPGLAETPITLDSDEYFVLGDNRNNSEDSRYGDIGLVNERYIVGKLWFTCAPVKKIGFLEG